MLLSFAGILLCGHWFFRLDLDGLAAHGKIEHDASLAHADAQPGSAMAPTTVDNALLRALLSFKGERGLTLTDLAHARVRREAQDGKPLDAVHRQIAQGESALIWLTLRDDHGVVPKERLEQWMGEERLPDDWSRPPTIGLLDTRKKADYVASEMGRVSLSRTDV